MSKNIKAFELKKDTLYLLFTQYANATSSNETIDHEKRDGVHNVHKDKNRYITALRVLYLDLPRIVPVESG